MTNAVGVKENKIIVGTNGYLVNNLLNGLFVVSIVMMFGATVSMSIDNIMAGHFIGADAIAAMNITMPLFVAISLVSSVIANGGSALAARFLGQNEKGRVNALFTYVLLADLIVGGVIIACVYPNVGAIVEAIGAKDAVLREMASQYIYGLLIGVLPIMFNAALLGFIRVAGNPHLSAISVLLMSAVNITLNYVFAELLDMGMFGLALATGTGYLASCLVSLSYLLRKKCFLRLAKLGNIAKSAFTMLNLGLPSALTSLTSVVRGIALNVVVAIQLGTIALQAMSVQSAISNLVGCASLGVGFTIIPLAGIFFGEQDKQAMHKTVKGALKLGLIVNVAFAAVISLLAQPLARMFNITDPGSVSMIMRSVWFFAASMPFAMASYAFVCYFQNVNRVWLANTLIIGKVVFLLICTLPLIPVLGDTAIWLGGFLSEFLSTLLALVVVGVINRRIPTSIKDILLLPKEWDKGFPCYEVSLKNDLEACVGFSAEIQDFCEENGVSKKTAYYTALCLEEMVANIIEHGFKDDKAHFIDIKVLMTGDRTKLRIRDSGMEFNPLDYSEKQSPAEAAAPPDEFKNIGIKILKGLAQSCDYRNTMRLNNLFIEIVDEKELMLRDLQSGWQKAESELKKALAGYAMPEKPLNRVMLACEELFSIVAADGAKELKIKLKPLKSGMSVSFSYQGGAYAPEKFEPLSPQGLSHKILDKTMDIFTYTAASGRNSLAVCKYW
jgi:Na+-driven multidrug efflux pump/anti-sigma regulatory factor (Ser/Thr protein kinase)